MTMEKFDFFPLNRALSLSAMDEDSTESKVDDLLRQIHQLCERQKEEDMRKKRDEERQKQLRWREEHRIALLQGNVPPRDAVDTLSIVDPYGVRRDSSRTPGAGGPGGALGTGGRNDAGAQAYRQKQWRRAERSTVPAAAGDEAPTGHDSMDTQDSSATGGGRSSAQPPEEVTPTTPRKAFGLRTKSKTPKQPQQLVDDSTLLVRGSPAASTATSPLSRFRAAQPSRGIKSPPPACGSPAAPAAATPMAAAAAVSAADHLIDFGDEHPMPADDIGLGPAEMSRSSSGAGSSTPRAISPSTMSATGIQPLPQPPAAFQAAADSRASTLPREPFATSDLSIAPAVPKPTADVLLDLDDLASPLPLPPTVRRRSPLPVSQWPAAASPPHPTAAASSMTPPPGIHGDSSRPPSQQQGKKSPSSTSSIHELGPLLGERRSPPAAEIDDRLIGAAGSGPGGMGTPIAPDVRPPQQPRVGGRTDDDVDDDFDVDDDDELDLRFLPGDFKSTNV